MPAQACHSIREFACSNRVNLHSLASCQVALSLSTLTANLWYIGRNKKEIPISGNGNRGDSEARRSGPHRSRPGVRGHSHVDGYHLALVAAVGQPELHLIAGCRGVRRCSTWRETTTIRLHCYQNYRRVKAMNVLSASFDNSEQCVHCQIYALTHVGQKGPQVPLGGNDGRPILGGRRVLAGFGQASTSGNDAHESHRHGKVFVLRPAPSSTRRSFLASLKSKAMMRKAGESKRKPGRPAHTECGAALPPVRRAALRLGLIQRPAKQKRN